MLRKFLTLLAICAGFAAVAEPARAVPMAVETVRQLERDSVACTQSTAQRLPQASPGWRLQDKGKPCPRPTVIVVVPTVMLKIDRARE